MTGAKVAMLSSSSDSDSGSSSGDSCRSSSSNKKIAGPISAKRKGRPARVKDAAPHEQRGAEQAQSGWQLELSRSSPLRRCRPLPLDAYHGPKV